MISQVSWNVVAIRLELLLHHVNIHLAVVYLNKEFLILHLNLHPLLLFQILILISA